MAPDMPHDRPFQLAALTACHPYIPTNYSGRRYVGRLIRRYSSQTANSIYGTTVYLTASISPLQAPNCERGTQANHCVSRLLYYVRIGCLTSSPRCFKSYERQSADTILSYTICKTTYRWKSSSLGALGRMNEINPRRTRRGAAL